MNFQDPHTILDGFESLRRHHLAKRKVREEQLTYIPLRPQAQVLDVGSGPGLYLEFWLKFSEASNAEFTLIDHQELALKMAQKEAEKANAANRVKYVQGDIFRLSDLSLPQFDVIFVGNTLEYIQDPRSYIKEEILPLLKGGGLLVVRDLDCSFVNCNLVDPGLNHKIVYSRIRNGQENSKDPTKFHNAFIGKDLAGILNQAGLANVRSKSYFIEFKHPLSKEAKEYISTIQTTWYLEDHLGILSEVERDQWKSSFDPLSPSSVLTKKDFFYVEAEFLAMGYKT